MKYIKPLILLFLISFQQTYSQQETANKKEIKIIIEKYSESVIKKDSIVFYGLFNDGSYLVRSD